MAKKPTLDELIKRADKAGNKFYLYVNLTIGAATRVQIDADEARRLAKIAGTLTETATHEYGYHGRGWSYTRPDWHNYSQPFEFTFQSR